MDPAPTARSGARAVSVKPARFTSAKRVDDRRSDADDVRFSERMVIPREPSTIFCPQKMVLGLRRDYTQASWVAGFRIQLPGPTRHPTSGIRKPGRRYSPILSERKEFVSIRIIRMHSYIGHRVVRAERVRRSSEAHERRNDWRTVSEASSVKMRFP